MELNKILTKTVLIYPNEFSQNIQEIIISRIQEKQISEEGVLVKLGDITKMSNMLSKDGRCTYFTVDINSTIVKPEIGLEISYTPSLISTKGIYGKLYGFINLFVPNNEDMKKWTFTNNTYKKGKTTISIGGEILVKIIDFRFDISKFNCICKLVE